MASAKRIATRAEVSVYLKVVLPLTSPPIPAPILSQSEAVFDGRHDIGQTLAVGLQPACKVAFALNLPGRRWSSSEVMSESQQNRAESQGDPKHVPITD